jgi:hypothetical protein
MTLKQYNPVKVKDPSSDGYSIRIHPRQSFQLVLTKVFDDEEFDVKLLSDFLVLEEFRDDANKQYYCFSQKYDLARWSAISTVFLGNIVLTVKPRGLTKEPEKIRMCVFLNCSDESKANVITVVNPDNHMLKIESNQIVHAVLLDTHSVRWNLVGIEILGMSCARSETVFNDVANVYDPKALFCPEPRNTALVINPTLDAAHNTVALEELHAERKSGAKEYHFFTHLSLAALKKAHTSPNGNHPMGDMRFTCKTDDGVLLEERNLTLIMALRGVGKRISTPEFQAIRHNTRFWHTPFASSARQSVLSPGFNESVDLPADADTLYIEIPQPSVYHSTERLAEEAFWSSQINLDARFGLRVQELTPRHVNGFMVQRFMVGGILANKPPGDLLFIGALRFSCRSYKEGYQHVSQFRPISISLWKVRGASEDRRKVAEFSYVGGGSRSIYRSPQWDKYEHQQQRQQRVSYDVELEQLHSDFDGIKIVSLSEIDGKPNSMYGYDFEDLMRYDKKKRGTTISTRSANCWNGNRKRGLLGSEACSQDEIDRSNWYECFDLI